MNTTPLSVSEESIEQRATSHLMEQRFEEPWFDEAPPSSQKRTSAPPVSVGEFLGDPVADGWLR